MLANWYLIGCKEVPWLRFHPKYEWVYFALYVSVAIHFWIYRKRKMKVPPGYDQSPNLNYVDTTILPYPAQLARNSGGKPLSSADLVFMIFKSEQFRVEQDTIRLPLRKIRGSKILREPETTVRVVFRRQYNIKETIFRRDG